MLGREGWCFSPGRTPFFLCPPSWSSSLVFISHGRVTGCHSAGHGIRLADREHSGRMGRLGRWITPCFLPSIQRRIPPTLCVLVGGHGFLGRGRSVAADSVDGVEHRGLHLWGAGVFSSSFRCVPWFPSLPPHLIDALLPVVTFGVGDMFASQTHCGGACGMNKLHHLEPVGAFGRTLHAARLVSRFHV